MAIDWIYDDGHVAFGVDWGDEYARYGKVTAAPKVYRWDSQNTSDGTSFNETLTDPDGSESYTVAWGSGGGTREVDAWRTFTYARKASAYSVTLEIDTSSGFGTWYGGSFHTVGALTRTSTLTIPALPPTPGTLTATRDSDNQVTLEWISTAGNIDAVCIERKTDAGTWGEIAVIWNASAHRYVDNSTASDHAYAYRVRNYHALAYGSYSNTDSVTMTPAAPLSITTAAAGGTSVNVTLENPSPVASKVQYQVSNDGGETWGATQDSPNLTSFAVTIAGTGMVKAWNYNATGTSAEILSDPITTICPPSAPTPRAPSTENIKAGPVTFAWDYYAPDNSRQTAWELRYSFNGGTTWQTSLTGTTETTASHTFTDGQTVTWQVRTWGAATTGGSDTHGGSAWSTAQTFNAYQLPQIIINDPPSPPSAVNTMPISIEAAFTDNHGTCKRAGITITHYDSPVRTYEPTITTSGGVTTIAYEIDGNDWLPESGETYGIIVDAGSSTGLSNSAIGQFLVSFTPPVPGELEIANDPETGYVSILATWQNSADPSEDAVSISVARVNADGTQTALLDQAQNGTAVVDKYAPLNTPYRYAVTTYSSAKAPNTTFVDNIIETNRWFAYWDGGTAWAIWNPKGGVTITRPEKKRVHYVGRTYPVSYDSLAIDRADTLKFTALLGEWADGFKKLMEDGGRGIYKGADGSVFHADFEYTTSANYSSATRIDDVSLTITRIDGGKL